jgi:hypothetical protein
MSEFEKSDYDIFVETLPPTAANAFFASTLGRTGARGVRVVIRLQGRYSNIVIIIVGDEQDAKAKMEKIPEIAYSFKTLVEQLKGQIFILVDNGLKAFKWDESTYSWKGAIVSPSIAQGIDVNDALRDCPIIMACANQVTEGPSLSHRYKLRGHLIFAMTKPIYGHGYNAVEQAINIFRSGLQITNTRIDDLMNRDIFAFWFGVNLPSGASDDLTTEIMSKLKPSNLIMIGGNVHKKTKGIFIRRHSSSDEVFLAFTLLLRLREDDNLGPQFSFIKDFLKRES